MKNIKDFLPCGNPFGSKAWAREYMLTGMAILTVDEGIYWWDAEGIDPNTGEHVGVREDSAANELFGETENYYTVPAVLVNGEPVILPWRETC